MTLEDLGNIGEFVAAIAVVVSLVYIAFQIRQGSRQISQNTNSVLGSVELETTRLHSHWLLSVAQSPELGRIWRLGIDAQRATLSRESGSKFTYVVAWRIHDDGLIRESLKSLVGFGEPCSRIVVRIAVPIFHDDDRGRERAIQTADHFVRDFKDAFEMLADG